MKKIILIGITVAIAMGFNSCKKEETPGSDDPSKFVEETFTASIQKEANGSDATKTSISDDNSVKWDAGDAIYYYTSNGGSESKFIVPEAGISAALTLKRGIDDKYYNLVYAGKTTPVFTLKTESSIVFDGVKPEQDGTFADADVCVASVVPGDKYITFKRVTGLLMFQTGNPDVRIIEIMGGRGFEYVAGNISVDPRAASPKGVLQGEGSTVITVRTGDISEKTCYVNVLPENYANGLKMIFKNDNGDVIGTVVKRKIDLSAGSCTMDLGNIDSQMNDLSAAGTANCYVVSAPGTYRFKAVKGNSDVAIETITGAYIHWESFGTDEAPAKGDLITGVSYDEATGYITFKTGNRFSTGGNAVIVARNATPIQWSWHIWLTDAPSAQTYFDHTFLDRNLGATSATPGEKGTLGLLYQWGRKDPFLAGENAGSTEVAACSYQAWVFQNDSVRLSDAINNPHTFYAGQIDLYEPTFLTDGIDWLREPNPDLWGSHSSKTIYDPCPVGYRVPEKEVFASFNVDNFVWDGVNHGRIYDNKVWYPAANYREVEDGKLPLVGVSGFYWSCTPASTDASYSYYMSFGSSGITPSNNDWRAVGGSIRCVAE